MEIIHNKPDGDLIIILLEVQHHGLEEYHH
jgi:hypothetical protein